MNTFELGPNSPEAGAALPEVLVASVEQETAKVYSELASQLNAEREDDNKFKIVPEDDLLEMATRWVRDLNVIDAINTGLYHTAKDPVVLLAVPHVDFAHEEIVKAWDLAGPNPEPRKYRYKDGSFWKDLKQWDSRSLCRFDSDDLSPIRFAAVETGFDAARRGPRLRDEANFDPAKTVFQLEELSGLRTKNTYVSPVDLLAGAFNAYRWKDRAPLPDDIKDRTYVWDVLLEPDDAGCIAGDGWIPTAHLSNFGYGDVSFVTGMYGNYSRRMVMAR